MAQYTDNYNLSMPEATDTQASFISAYRQNMEIIDDNLGGGGGSANIVELTQAEYDALPDSKYTDDVLYAIKDVYSAGAKLMGLGACYSTTEKQIGCWTDGKPLYQKTWDLGSDVTLTASGWTQISLIVISDYDMEKIIHGVAQSSSKETIEALNYSGNTNDRLYLFNPRNAQFAIRYITLQYTKTADTAGSGNWTPEAIPAVHYDGNEKIIGTWLGQTLYEKTVTLSAVTNGTKNLWSDSTVVIKNHFGFFQFRNNEKNTLSLVSRPSDANYKACVAGVGNNNTNVYVDLEIGTSRSGNLDLYITIQYTKTS